MAAFLFANLPHDCSEREVQHWVEAFGFTVKDLRIVRDLVSGGSPVFAHVTLYDNDEQISAQTVLDGKTLRNRRAMVRKVVSAPPLFRA